MTSRKVKYKTADIFGSFAFVRKKQNISWKLIYQRRLLNMKKKIYLPTSRSKT